MTVSSPVVACRLTGSALILCFPSALQRAFCLLDALQQHLRMILFFIFFYFIFSSFLGSSSLYLAFYSFFLNCIRRRRLLLSFYHHRYHHHYCHYHYYYRYHYYCFVLFFGGGGEAAPQLPALRPAARERAPRRAAGGERGSWRSCARAGWLPQPFGLRWACCSSPVSRGIGEVSGFTCCAARQELRARGTGVPSGSLGLGLP